MLIFLWIVRERIQFSRAQIGERQKFNEKQRLEMEEFQREAQIRQVASSTRFCFLIFAFAYPLITSSLLGQDQIELELAAREKEVDQSEQNIKNYEQTLIVRYDGIMI